MVRAAVYVRLSDEDRNKSFAEDESESIQNQKSMLTAYCGERNWDIYDIYCDEDYSGIDSERPDFKRMLSDCENGRIDIVLCKSQSRFTRDMEIIERYIHNKFLEWNVRFVSVVDHADSSDAANKKARQINGLINEWYLEDASDNIRSTLKHKRENGEFTGSFAPYGYLVDPSDKNHLIIDSEAAEVVRRIFEWYLSGWGYRKIAEELNGKKVANPTSHKQQKLGSRYVNKNESAGGAHGMWTKSTIYAIIRNETYTGTLVQGKSHSVSYKNKRRKRAGEDEWIRTADTHEAIIDKETWKKTCERLKSRVRSDKTTQTLSPLAGKVKCGCCETAMKRSVYYNKKKTIKYSSYTCGLRKKGALCDNAKPISGAALERCILKQLNELIKSYCDTDKIQLNSAASDRLATLTAEYEYLKRELSGKEEKLLKIYEDKLDGIISAEQYRIFNGRTETAIENIREKLLLNEKQLEKAREQKKNEANSDEIIKQFLCVKKLTRRITEKFIDTVYIGKAIDGEKRLITIKWAV